MTSQADDSSNRRGGHPAGASCDLGEGFSPHFGGLFVVGTLSGEGEAGEGPCGSWRSVGAGSVLGGCPFSLPPPALLRTPAGLGGEGRELRFAELPS